ncbi:MAG: hypothetical protein R2792_19305 [Saprospiraceae bacterium]
MSLTKLIRGISHSGMILEFGMTRDEAYALIEKTTFQFASLCIKQMLHSGHVRGIFKVFFAKKYTNEYICTNLNPSEQKRRRIL